MILFLVFLFGLSLFPFPSSSKTCCWRNVGTEILFAYDKESKIYNDMGYIGTDSGWDQVFLSAQYGGGAALKCPRIDVLELNPVKPVPRKPLLDYVFSGRYTVTGDGSPPRGYAVTLHVDLIDQGHGKTVKSANANWLCVPREAGYCVRVGLEETVKLGRTFQPLDSFIYDYERIPETARVELETDPILAGERMKIVLRNLVDANSKPSQPWQRILIKAEKGRILNGESRGDFKVFQVGSGTVEVEYQAPDGCKNDLETLTVMNSCTIRPDVPATPEREIVRKTFNIFCVEGKIRITEDWSALPSHPLKAQLVMPICGYQGGSTKKVPALLAFRLKPTKDPCVYEIVDKGGSASIYEERYVPSNRNCCDYQYASSKLYRLSDKPAPSVVNLRKSPEKPLSVSISNRHTYTAECLNAPPKSPLRKIDYSGEWDLHNNLWPLKNGHVDDIKTSRFELIIDEKEVKELKNRCARGK